MLAALTRRLSMFSSIKRRLGSLALRKKAVILAYHGVNNKPLPFKIWTQIDVDRFDAHIKYLASDCNCVSLSTLVDNVRKSHIEPRTVVVTFDDGFYNNFSVAFPILKKYNVPATIYVAAGYTGTSNMIWSEQLATTLAVTTHPTIRFEDAELSLSTPDLRAHAYRQIANSLKSLSPSDIDQRIEEYMGDCQVIPNDLMYGQCYEQFRMLGWEELEELISSGLIEIGAHTMKHAILSRLSDEEAYCEMELSKKILEDRLGTIRHFAYPNGGHGDFSEVHRKMAMEIGYESVSTFISGTVSRISDVFELQRFGLGSDSTVEAIDYFMRGGALLV